MWIYAHDMFINMITVLKSTHVLGRYCLNHNQDAIPERKSYTSASLSSLPPFPCSTFPNIHRSLKIPSFSFQKPHSSPQEEIYPLDPFQYCINLRADFRGTPQEGLLCLIMTSSEQCNGLSGSSGGSVLVHVSYWNFP